MTDQVEVVTEPTVEMAINAAFSRYIRKTPEVDDVTNPAQFELKGDVLKVTRYGLKDGVIVTNPITVSIPIRLK